MNVRRTQMELQNVWTMYKGRRAAQKGISMEIWLLRMEMTFLIDNLQYYLQVGHQKLNRLDSHSQQEHACLELNAEPANLAVQANFCG